MLFICVCMAMLYGVIQLLVRRAGGTDEDGRYITNALIFCLCCYVGHTADQLAIGAAIGLFVVVIFNSLVKEADESPDTYETRKRIEQQDKYDNDWGIIDYTDKK